MPLQWAGDRSDLLHFSKMHNGPWAVLGASYTEPSCRGRLHIQTLAGIVLTVGLCRGDKRSLAAEPGGWGAHQVEQRAGQWPDLQHALWLRGPLLPGHMICLLEPYCALSLSSLNH